MPTPLTCVNNQGKDVPACCHACGEMLEALTKKDALADGWKHWYDMGWWFCEACGLPEEAEDKDKEVECVALGCKGSVIHPVGSWCETCINQPDPKGVRVQHGSYVYQKQ